VSIYVQCEEILIKLNERSPFAARAKFVLRLLNREDGVSEALWQALNLTTISIETVVKLEIFPALRFRHTHKPSMEDVQYFVEGFERVSFFVDLKLALLVKEKGKLSSHA
jgi:hypothetical protein